MEQFRFRFGDSDINKIDETFLCEGIIPFPNNFIDNDFFENEYFYLVPSENKNMIEICTPSVAKYIIEIINNYCVGRNGRVIKRYYISRMFQISIDNYKILLPEKYKLILIDKKTDTNKKIKLNIGYRNICNREERIYSIWNPSAYQQT